MYLLCVRQTIRHLANERIEPKTIVSTLIMDEYAYLNDLNLEDVTAEVREADRQQRTMQEAGDSIHYQSATKFYTAARRRFQHMGGDIETVFPSAPADIEE